MEYMSESGNGYREQNQALLPQQPPTSQSSRVQRTDQFERTEHVYQPAEEQIELELTKHSVVTTTTKMEDENERMLKQQKQQQQQQEQYHQKEGTETTTHHTVIEMSTNTPAGTKASQTDIGNSQQRSGRHGNNKKNYGGDASQLSAGLNMFDRDEKNINKHAELMFEDIMAEPDGTHSFDFVFSSSFLTFTMCRYWIYRALTAILAIPLALLWAIVFALLGIVNNWLVMPTLRVFGVFFTWIQLFTRMIVHNVFDPLFESIGKVFYNVRYNYVQPPTNGGQQPPGGGPGGFYGYPYQYVPANAAPPTAATTTTLNPSVIGWAPSAVPTTQQRIVQTHLA